MKEEPRRTWLWYRFIHDWWLSVLTNEISIDFCLYLDQVRANSNSPKSKKLKRDNDVEEVSLNLQCLFFYICFCIYPSFPDNTNKNILWQDLCDFTEALKKCETTDKMLEMARSLFRVEARDKYRYRDEANDLREEKTSLEKDKVN